MKVNKDPLVPYFVMVVAYLGLAALAILDNAFALLKLAPPLTNLRWLVVHMVALGVLTQLIFGVTPVLAASRLHQPIPKFHPLTWLFLNGGLAVLVAGILAMSFILITTGGTLIFLAVFQLVKQLTSLRPPGPTSTEQNATRMRIRNFYQRLHSSRGLKFYLAGLLYLLVGILVGTGLWQGWSGPLRIVTPKEVHVHSNLWGFAALVLAGLLVDLSPQFTRRSQMDAGSTTPIFWLMATGALGLVTGPWLGIDALTVGGLVLHTVGTVWLLINLVKPVRHTWRKWTPGFWHLVIAYIWFLLAVVVAPLVVAGTGTGSGVASQGGPILIYGWIMQVIFALVPYLFQKGLSPLLNARLGGTWFSLLIINAGAIAYWMSMFLPSRPGWLPAIAYMLWILSMIPIIFHLKTAILSRSEWIPEQDRFDPLQEAQ